MLIVRTKLKLKIWKQEKLKIIKGVLKEYAKFVDLRRFCYLAKQLCGGRKPGGDFVNFLNTLIPGEKHLPKHSFTGPGTRLDLRLNEDLTPKEFSKPINRVDEAAYKHDIKYMDDSKEARQQADIEMIEELQTIPNPTFREKVERAIVIPILKTKKFLGLGITPFELRDIINGGRTEC